MIYSEAEKANEVAQKLKDSSSQAFDVRPAKFLII